ncbi:hypothetical protein Hanom_Chr03g00182491 [Helianthus anomalus]
MAVRVRLCLVCDINDLYERPTKRILAPNNSTDEYLGLPLIAANEPILCLTWEQIAILLRSKINLGVRVQMHVLELKSI